MANQQANVTPNGRQGFAFDQILRIGQGIIKGSAVAQIARAIVLEFSIEVVLGLRNETNEETRCGILASSG